MKINWIIFYSDNKLNDGMAKLKASSYGKAHDQAEKVINEMNSTYKKNGSDRLYTLTDVRNLDCVEDWTNI